MVAWARVAWATGKCAARGRFHGVTKQVHCTGSTPVEPLHFLTVAYTRATSKMSFIRLKKHFLSRMGCVVLVLGACVPMQGPILAFFSDTKIGRAQLLKQVGEDSAEMLEALGALIALCE